MTYNYIKECDYMPIIKCETCNKEFKIYNSDIGRKKYCSVPCANEGRKRRVKFNCIICGVEFEKHPSKAKQSENKYCSKKCTHIGLQNRETRQCTICGKDVTRAKSHFSDNVLCSKECTNKFHSIKQLGEKNHAYNKVEMECVICGKHFNVSYSRVQAEKGKCCSVECKRLYLSELFRGENNPYYKNGEHTISHKYRGYNWNEQRELALERDGHKCTICGSEKNLQVHHIIRYTEFNGDYISANQLENLQTLCCSCHSRIENRQDIAKLNKLSPKPIPR